MDDNFFELFMDIMLNVPTEERISALYITLFND